MVLCSDGSEIKADMVIKALGFDPEDLPKLFNNSNLMISKWGTIKVKLLSFPMRGRRVGPKVFYLRLTSIKRLLL